MGIGEKNSKNRDKTIDILRGLGILLMIMGHIGIGLQPYDDIFSIWYHAFHMPMFYVISGYFFDKTNTDESGFVTKKAKRLLIPYFFWGIFHILYSYCLNGDIELLRDNVVRMFIDPTIGGVPIAKALWFLPALFWINVIFFWMNRIFENRWLLFTASILVGLCGMVATSKGIYLPMALDSALVGVAFMGTGSLMRDFATGNLGKKVFHMRWYIFIILFVLINYLIFFNGEVNFRSGKYGIYTITYINAVIGTILLWNCARTIGEKCDGRAIHIVSDALASIGKDSIIYVCLNQWMILCIKNNYTDVYENRTAWQLIARILTLATVCFGCHVVMKIMNGNNKRKKEAKR